MKRDQVWKPLQTFFLLSASIAINFPTPLVPLCPLAHYKYFHSVCHMWMAAWEGWGGWCFYRKEGREGCWGQMWKKKWRKKKSKVWVGWNIEGKKIKGGGQERWSMWMWRKLLGAALLWQANWSSVWQRTLSCHSNEEPICCILQAVCWILMMLQKPQATDRHHVTETLLPRSPALGHTSHSPPQLSTDYI